MSQYATQEEIEAAKLTSEEAERMQSWLAGDAGGARCCGAHDVWVQGYSSGTNEWCSRGASGTHIRIFLARGCRTHQQYMGTFGAEIARRCALDCSWAHELDEEQEPDYESAYGL